MAQRRPVSFVILAIFNFLTAGCFMACGVCANVMDSQTWFIEINGVRFDEKKLDNHLKEKAPAYKPVKITGIVLGYAVCIGLILAGVALFFGGLLPKLFALFVYGVGLLHHGAMSIYQLVWVNPAIEQFFNQIPGAIFVGRAPAEIARTTSRLPGYVSITWWVVGCLFYLAASAVVLISFIPSGKSAAKDDDDRPPGRSKRRRDYDDDDDEDEDDRPRRRSRR